MDVNNNARKPMINKRGGEGKIGEVGIVAKSTACYPNDPARANPGDLTHYRPTGTTTIPTLASLCSGRGSASLTISLPLIGKFSSSVLVYLLENVLLLFCDLWSRNLSVLVLFLQ